MSISDISPIGLPQSLKYDQLPSISDSVTNYQVSVAPSGLTQVGPITTGASESAFVVSGSGFINAPFVAQNLDFQIPSGHGDNIFLDTRETFLTFRLAVNCTTAIVGGSGLLMHLIGSASSFIESLSLFSNNVPVENIYNYNILYNQLLNANITQSEKYGAFSIAQGCDVDSMTGVNLNFLQTGIQYYTFTVPLISIIGLNTAGVSGKLFPVGSVSNLLLRIGTTPLLPFSTHATGTLITTPPIFQVTLDSFNLNMSYVNIGEISGALLKQSLLNGQYFIKSCTYTGANCSISNQTAGNVTLPLQIRNSSVKSLFWQFSVPKSNKSPNSPMEGLNLSSISINVNIGGNKFPQRSMNPTNRPSECYTHYQCAWGASAIKQFGGCLNRSSYGATVVAVAGSDSSIVVPSATGYRAISQVETTTVLPQNIIVSFPHCHFEGINLERISGSLFSGINTRMAPPFIEMTIASATDVSAICYAFALSDCILKIDPATKTLEVLL